MPTVGLPTVDDNVWDQVQTVLLYRSTGIDPAKSEYANLPYLKLLFIIIITYLLMMLYRKDIKLMCQLKCLCILLFLFTLYLYLAEIHTLMMALLL